METLSNTSTHLLLDPDACCLDFDYGVEEHFDERCCRIRIGDGAALGVTFHLSGNRTAIVQMLEDLLDEIAGVMRAG